MTYEWWTLDCILKLKIWHQHFFKTRQRNVYNTRWYFFFRKLEHSLKFFSGKKRSIEFTHTLWGTMNVPSGNLENVGDENNILGGKRQRPILHKRDVTWEFWHRIHFYKRKIYEFQWGPYLFSPRWQLINYALMIHGTYKMKTT